MDGGSGRAEPRPVGMRVELPRHIAERGQGVAQRGVGVAADRVALHAHRPGVADGAQGTEHGEVVEIPLVERLDRGGEAGSPSAGAKPPAAAWSGASASQVVRSLRHCPCISPH